MNSTVKDLIEIKGRVAVTYGKEGLVVIFPVTSEGDTPQEGDQFVIECPDGWLYRGRAKDTRFLGNNHAGFFVDGLVRSDVPIGSAVRWRDNLWPVASRETAETMK